MNITQCEHQAKKLIAEYLPDRRVHFQWSRATIHVGSYEAVTLKRDGRIISEIICLSKKFAECNIWKNISKVLKHEITHALVGQNHGHDDVFKQKCLEIGGCLNYYDMTDAIPITPYVFECPKCHTVSAVGKVTKNIKNTQFRCVPCFTTTHETVVLALKRNDLCLSRTM